MGWLGTLGKVLGGVGSIAAAPFTAGTSLAWLPAALGAGGAALGAIGQSKAQNRDAQLGAQNDLERLLLAREGIESGRDQDFYNQGIQREQEGRASGTDAWRKLLAAQRTIEPGARPQLSPYSVAPRQRTGAELQGADAMTQEVMARLQGGNQLPMPTRRAPLPPVAMDPKLMKPGGLESAAGWLSPILAFLGQQGQTPTSSTQPIRSSPYVGF
jgi:hypothetical protein